MIPLISLRAWHGLFPPTSPEIHREAAKPETPFSVNVTIPC